MAAPSNFDTARPWTATLLCGLASVLGGLAFAAPAAANNFEARVVTESPKTLSPGQWGNLAVIVVNPEDEPMELEAIVAFGSATGREFSRTVWLPARSRRICWLPVQAPQKWPDRGWEIRARFLRRDESGKMVVQRLESNRALFETTMAGKTKERHPTAVMIDADAPDSNSFYDALQEVRKNSSLSSKVHACSGARPATPQWLDGVSVLIVADDIVDGGSLASIRRWVRSGGRLWLMADRVSDDTMLSLLGDLAPAIVGRESLTTAVFSRDQPSYEESDVRNYDAPKPACLVVDPPGSTLVRVNDWPALTTAPLNAGQVLVSTVDLTAWPYRSRIWLSDYIYAGMSEQQLAGNVSWPSSLQEVASESLAAQVGQRIPSRGAVLAVLGALTLCLAGGGLVLLRREQLDRLVWLIPLCSLLATGALILIGRTARQAAPPTIATIQVARVAPGTGTLNIHGAALTYLPEATAEPIAGGSAFVEGVEFPERTSNTGVGQWRWDGAGPPPGARVYQFNDEAPSSLRATATFTERGIEGRLSPAPEQAESVVIGARGMPSLAVHWQPDGRFHAGPDDVLGAGQHTPAELLDDQERRRQQFLAKFWSPDVSDPHPGQLDLALWTGAFPSDVQWPEAQQRLGEALIIAPLEFTPLAPGSRVSIPGSALALQLRSSMFNVRQQRWTGVYNGASSFHSQFVLPRVAATLRAERATLVLKLSSPGREVRVFGADGQLLESLNGLVGVERLEIESPASLSVKDGVIDLRFDVLEAEGRAADADWSVDYMYLNLEGVVE